MEQATDPLEQRLAGARRWHIEYDGFLSNHLTHNWVVMALGGAPDARLDWWEQIYTEGKLGPPPAVPEPGGSRRGSPLNVDELPLGCGMPGYAELQATLDAQVQSLGIVAAVRKHLPSLANGPVAAAFHPLIHLGLGVEANSPSMVADALAYWTCVHQPLGRPGSAAWVRSPASLLSWFNDALVDARASSLSKTVWRLSETPAYRARKRGPFQQRLMVFADPDAVAASWLEQRGPVPLPDGSEQLLKTRLLLRRWLTQLLLASHNEFFVVHAVTSFHSMEQLLPLLEPSTAQALLAHWCRAALATLVGQGLPGWDALAEVQARPARVASGADWSALREASWASHDEHVPKAVYVLGRWAAEDTEATNLFVEAASGLVAPQPGGDLGNNLWFGPPAALGGSTPAP